MSSCVTSTLSWSFALGFSQTRTHTLPPHAATRSTRQFLPFGYKLFLAVAQPCQSDRLAGVDGERKC